MAQAGQAVAVNTGLIGYGTAGAVFHAPLIRAEPRLALTAVASRRRDDIVRALPGVRVAGSPGALIEDPDIELVVIATPNDSHHQLAAQALQAGKHVVIDKPLTATAAQADALIALARRQKRYLSVFQNRRWDGDFLTVQRLNAAGELGEIQHFEARFDRYRPLPKSGWRETSAPGAGLLYDLGSHLIDQALQLFGWPKAVYADIQSQRAAAQADDWFQLLLRYGTRRVILGASCLVAGAGPHFAVHGDCASFVKYGMDSQEATLKAGGYPGQPGWGEGAAAERGLFTDAQGQQRRLVGDNGAYERYYAGIAASLLDGASLPVTAEQASDVIRIIEVAQRSASERREIVPGSHAA